MRDKQPQALDDQFEERKPPMWIAMALLGIFLFAVLVGLTVACERTGGTSS